MHQADDMLSKPLFYQLDGRNIDGDRAIHHMMLFQLLQELECLPDDDIAQGDDEFCLLCNRDEVQRRDQLHIRAL